MYHDLQKQNKKFENDLLGKLDSRKNCTCHLTGICASFIMTKYKEMIGQKKKQKSKIYRME